MFPLLTCVRTNVSLYVLQQQLNALRVTLRFRGVLTANLCFGFLL